MEPKKYYFGSDCGDFLQKEFEGNAQMWKHDTFSINDTDGNSVELYVEDFKAMQVAFEKMLRGE